MPEKPVIGGTRWQREGIEAAKAHWGEAEAFRDALVNLSSNVTDPELRLEILQILNKQATALNYLRDALHELDLIGLDAKRKRLDDGETS